MTIPGSGSATVSVFDVGELLPGDIVRAGLAGPPLTVSSVNLTDVEVTLANAASTPVDLEAGTRLIDLTNPPTAYADALGAFALGTHVNADSGGRAIAYLNLKICDYVVIGEPPVLSTPAFATKNNVGGNTLSWNHTMSGEDRLVLVAVAWQETSVSETLDSVTYDGVEMTRIATAVNFDVFALTNPPSGTKVVQAVWSEAEQRGNRRSQGFSNVDPELLYGAVVLATSITGVTAPLTVHDCHPNAQVFSALSVNTVPGLITATPTPAMHELWNQTAGSAGSSNRTTGAAATQAGDWANVIPSWTWSGSRVWAMVGMEVRPILRLFTDQPGVSCGAREFGLNATHYASLQQAIDALPAKGGVLHIPAGTYRLKQGLVINKPNVTLLGEGETTVITTADPVALPIDLLTITAEETRLCRMKFDGAAVERDLTDGASCIVVKGQGLSGRLVIFCKMEDVIVTGAARYGVWLRDAISFISINCNISSNLGTGIRIQGTPTALGSAVALRFYSTHVAQQWRHRRGSGRSISTGHRCRRSYIFRVCVRREPGQRLRRAGRDRPRDQRQ